jgi:hypothetical protein
VEGITAINAFVSSAAAEYRQATVTVPVSDGRLTLDAIGGHNTKLNYVDVGWVTVDPSFALKVNFSDAATAPPAGYVRDSGDAFSATRGYGWVDLGEGTPLTLTGNGRNRNPAANQPDVRLATFMHAQLPAGSAGVSIPGKWEAAVPNGSYTVTVAVGDAGTAVDSSDEVNIEDQNAIAAFTPTASAKFATATRTVTVTDGRVTLSPAGGPIPRSTTWRSPGSRARTPRPGYAPARRRIWPPACRPPAAWWKTSCCPTAGWTRRR